MRPLVRVGVTRRAGPRGNVGKLEGPCLAIRRPRTVLAIVALLLGGALGLATAGVSAAESTRSSP